MKVKRVISIHLAAVSLNTSSISYFQIARGDKHSGRYYALMHWLRKLID